MANFAESGQQGAVAMSSHIRVERRFLAREVVEALRESLCQQPEGTRLPSERELARQLSVSMTALRKALPELLASGEVLRSGRKTFVGRPGSPGGLPDSMHTFLLARTQPPRPATVLDLVTYEHLPAQRRCWARMAVQCTVKCPRKCWESAKHTLNRHTSSDTLNRIA